MLLWLLTQILLCIPFSSSEALHNVIECSIFDLDGVLLRDYGPSRCVFFPDGSWAGAASQDHSLTYYRNDNSKVWQRRVLYHHHQLNLSLDGHHLLTIGASFHNYRGHRVMFDDFSVYDLEGRLVKYLDLYKIRKQVEKYLPEEKAGIIFELTDEDVRWLPPGVTYEYSHANAFYEIPPNQAAFQNSAFAAGNYVATLLQLGLVVIFDRDLHEVLWAHSAPPTKWRSVLHDVQVLESGNLLVYNNVSFGEQFSEVERASSITLVDPQTGIQTVLYSGDLKTPFYSSANGGAQLLPGVLLISDITNGGQTKEIDLLSGLVLRTFDYPELDAKTGRPRSFQQVKRMNLTSFLKKNSGI